MGRVRGCAYVTGNCFRVVVHFGLGMRFRNSCADRKAGFGKNDLFAVKVQRTMCAYVSLDAEHRVSVSDLNASFQTNHCAVCHIQPTNRSNVSS
jgi:hypothetical protein